MDGDASFGLAAPGAVINPSGLQQTGGTSVSPASPAAVTLSAALARPGSEDMSFLRLDFMFPYSTNALLITNI